MGRGERKVLRVGLSWDYALSTTGAEIGDDRDVVQDT